MWVMLEEAGRNLVEICFWFRKYERENVEQGCLRCSAVLSFDKAMGKSLSQSQRGPVTQGSGSAFTARPPQSLADM